MAHTRAGQAHQSPQLGSVSETPPRQLDLTWVFESGSESRKKKKRGGKKNKNSEHESVKLDAYYRELERKLNEPLELI